MPKYVAFLRGINVSGHHKVPMAELREELGKLGCENVITLLNSGNVIFDSAEENMGQLESTIAQHLESYFGFPVPTIMKGVDSILHLLEADPFKDIEVTKEIRLYLTFLRKAPEVDLQPPWSNEDGSFKILEIIDNTIISVLDLSISNTPKAMEIVEKTYGKDITTRNWNTLKRIEQKL